MSSIAQDAFKPALYAEALANPVPRVVVEIYKWATDLGLRGAHAEVLFDGYCRKLATNGVRLLRGHVSTQPLPPQWRGYGYPWRRESNAVRVQQFARRDGEPSEEWR